MQQQQQGGAADSEFPIVCERCLGDSPFMRMTKLPNGQECKNCTRPFCTFRWLPAPGMPYRRTEICESCSRIKNVCQTCLLDLEYGMTTHVRDTMIGASARMPAGEANKLWYLRAAEEKLNATGQSAVDYARLEAVAKKTMKAMATSSSSSSSSSSSTSSVATSAGKSLHKKPYNSNSRNRASVGNSNDKDLGASKRRVCTKWLKGNCTRGSDCRFRHEL